MSTALYRRYRPDTFTEVIGQEHVTEPLMQALRADKITHAYLFSGPRGCGKTTSARILARCLNCAEGPTVTPCGVCDSCRELGTGGPGSLDVVEIDAASHNGVDDARDLRERAAFAPARDRFKIFILDEAHMVTTQGFNALLKLVEEPPPHVKFIFATTEPDKVIGTIRSRTHHYPFRLVAPDTLQPYLEKLCEAEGVPVGSGVLPLVVRAGGGSVRDSLSVLDQLVAGAHAEGLDYERAVALLGYTHATLLDDTVDAIAARDGASAFRVVDRVVSSGHEPRRFVEDLLERLRDLIVIAASGDAAQAVLRDLPADQLERMRTQASVLGASELSRSADLVNAALSEMTGATSPRLHLELLVARLLLPSADDGVQGVGARLDRVERELAQGGSGRVGAGVAPPMTSATVAATAVPAAMVTAATVPATTVPATTVPATTVPATTVPAVAPPAPGAAPAGAGSARATTAATTVTDAPAVTPVAPAAPRPAPAAAEASSPAAPPADHAAEVAPTPAGRGDAAPSPEASSQPEQDVLAHRGVTGVAAVEAELVRRRWSEVLQTLKGLRMATWVLVSQNAQVSAVGPDTVTLAFSTAQLATTFRTGPHSQNVQRALHETLGLDVRIETVLAEAAARPAPVTGAAPEAAPAPGSAAGDDRQAAGSAGAAPGPRPAPGAPEPATDHLGRISTRQAEASWGAPAGPEAPVRRAAATPSAGPAAPARPGAASPSAVQPATGPAAPARPAAASPSAPPPAGALEAGRPIRRPVAPPSDGIPDGPEPGDDGPPESTHVPQPSGPLEVVVPWASGPSADWPEVAVLPGAAASPAAPTSRSMPTPPSAPSAPNRHSPAPSSATVQSPRGPRVPRVPPGTAPRTGARPGPQVRPPVAGSLEEGADASPDDPDLVTSGLVGAPLVAQMLGGTVIDEIPDPPA